MSHGSTSGRVHIHDESHMPRTCWKRKVVTARSGARHVGQTTTKLRTVRKVTRGSWIRIPSSVKEANLGKGVEAGGWPSLCKEARQAWPAPSQTATPQQFRGWTAVCEGWFGRVHVRDESQVRRIWWERKVVTAWSGTRHVRQTTSALRTVRKVTLGSPTYKRAYVQPQQAERRQGRQFRRGP